MGRLVDNGSRFTPTPERVGELRAEIRRLITPRLLADHQDRQELYLNLLAARHLPTDAPAGIAVAASEAVWEHLATSRATETEHTPALVRIYAALLELTLDPEGALEANEVP